MTDIRDYPEAYQDMTYPLDKEIERLLESQDQMQLFQAKQAEVIRKKSHEIELLQKQLKDALQNAEYAWKNTNLIEKDRQRLMKENDRIKELLNEAYPWVAYWDTNNDALRLCQDIHVVIGERK